MARKYIHNKLILTYESKDYIDVYWTKISQIISEKYGKIKISDSKTVICILNDCFNFFINEFKDLIFEEKTFSFFMYIFFLHEQSLELNVKLSKGEQLKGISEMDYARYRRILKLILEQGCDNDLTWGEFPNPQDIYKIDEKMQRLFYLGTWIYEFAEYIAYEKMINGAKEIDFNKNGYLEISWQKHYGIVYDYFTSKFSLQYENATIDQLAIPELKKAIKDCFEIDYDVAGTLIFDIKNSFNNGLFQTIEPYVLPINLAAYYKVDPKEIECFYNGLSISRNNKLSIENAVRKPHSTERYLYRPMLIYNIDNVERALISEMKFAESMYVLATNAISWNSAPIDWKNNLPLVRFLSKKGNEHDKILEDKVEKIIVEKKCLYCRNIISFKQLKKKDNINIEKICGEIDFIIVNIKNSKIFVVDSKYNKARYEGVGYKMDYTNFVDQYEPKLKKKLDWITNNKVILQKHLQITYNLPDLDLMNFDVEGAFFINTPTFYMMNGNYNTITLYDISNYINGTYMHPIKTLN